MAVNRAQVVADIRDQAGRSEAQACQVADASSRDEVLGPLLGLITSAATLRDMAAEIYVLLTEAGEEWE
jgi:hypothetical protein